MVTSGLEVVTTGEATAMKRVVLSACTSSITSSLMPLVPGALAVPVR